MTGMEGPSARLPEGREDHANQPPKVIEPPDTSYILPAVIQPLRAAKGTPPGCMYHCPAV